MFNAHQANTICIKENIQALDYDLFMQFVLNNPLLGHHLEPGNKPKKARGYKALSLPEYPIESKPRKGDYSQVDDVLVIGFRL